VYDQNQTFLQGINFTIPVGAIDLICIFLAPLKSMTRWQLTKHVATRLAQASARTTLMVEFS